MTSIHPCDAVAALQESWVYAVITCGKFVMCSAGAILTAIQWKKRGVSWLRHTNSKSIFSLYYPLLFSIALIYGAIYGFEFIRLRFPCFAFDFRLILSLRVAGTAAITAAHLMLVLISLERLVYSRRPLHFERPRNRRLAIILSSTITVVSLCLIAYGFSDQFRLFSTQKLVASIDIRVDENKDDYMITHVVMSCVFVFTSLIFLIDWWLNFQKNLKVHNAPLAVSYQNAQKRTETAILIRLEAATSLITIVAMLAQMIYSVGTSFSPLWTLLFPFLLEMLLKKQEQKQATAVATLSNLENQASQANYRAWLEAAWQ